jgi:4-hydroxy-tetrahydrodipicolinate synthase
MAMNPFRGTYTALITPFRNGAVDFAALERHVERQLEGGVDGLVPCGTTGESPTLSSDEQRRVVECVVKQAAGRVPVLAGAGTNSTAKTIELAKALADCGANGLLIVSPYYNRPSQQGLFEHFQAVAEAVDLPIVLYNIPGRCGVEISLETIRRLYSGCKNIVAVKHATGRIDDAAELLLTCEIGVLSGDDPLTFPLMALGAVGVISVLSNLMPRAVTRLTQAVLAGDWSAARQAHDRLFRLGRALLTADTNPVPIKTALAVRGLCAEEFRLPLCPMEPAKRSRLIALVNEAEIE